MVLDMNMCYESVFEFIMVFFNLSVFRFQVYSLQSIDSNTYLFILLYFQINSKKVSKGIFFPLFLGQLTVPHDVISSSGVSDSALPGHPGGKYLFFVSSPSVKMRGFSFLSL